MMNKQHDVKKIIRISTLSLGILLIVFYSLFQAKNIILGPRFTINEPLDGQTLLEEEFTFSGNAHNVASITLNDSPIFIDETGVFNEKLIAPLGYSIMKLEVKDRFGRSKIEYVHLILKEKTYENATEQSSERIMQ
jgi:hypothetical protein